MYMFVILAKPSPENERCAALREARVHIWVNRFDESDALQSANAYIEHYGWIPSKVECAFEIQDKQIPKLGVSESRLYEQACLSGIAADFLAYPLKEGKPNDPVCLERMIPLA